jgi:hypothetical protein
MSDHDRCASDDHFSCSSGLFESVVSFLGSDEAAGLEHGELEERLEERSREVFRQLYQEHLDLRAEREQRLGGVVDSAGVARASVECGHSRGLATVFGAVQIERRAYRRRGHENLHPADAALNLPDGRHSHGMRRWAAIESTRGSFDAAVDAIYRATGQKVGKRQVESLARAASLDVDAFYASRVVAQGEPNDVVVISLDGKGIVMRPDALRPATRRAAQACTAKLKARLSKGEKRGHKRMAELGAVYDITPVPRAPTDIFASGDQKPAEGPHAKNKWLAASVVEDAAEVVRQVFDEAERRDPDHQRSWVALVDGNNHQIQRINAEAADRDIEITIVIDWVHVLEYLWSAVWSFFAEGDPAAETWVRDRGLAVLEGGARDVAAGIRRRTSIAKLSPTARKGADECANYLINKQAYLDYPGALAAGWHIATGIIEGACRHIVVDRMDLTGARWSLEGAEAVLKLRAVRANGDWPAYWKFHLTQERQRVHHSRYLNNTLPTAA